MNDMHYIGNGFTILALYGGTGEVNVDRGGTLYAGPEELTEEEFRDADRVDLENNYWHFNETLNRWGYSL